MVAVLISISFNKFNKITELLSLRLADFRPTLESAIAEDSLHQQHARCRAPELVSGARRQQRHVAPPHLYPTHLLAFRLATKFDAAFLAGRNLGLIGLDVMDF